MYEIAVMRCRQRRRVCNGLYVSMRSHRQDKGLMAIVLDQARCSIPKGVSRATGYESETWSDAGNLAFGQPKKMFINDVFLGQTTSLT